MIIREITIINFGPFNGRKKITFGKDGYGVHLIRGNTGAGKTSIQRAVLWCLFGKVFDRSGYEIKPTSLLNSSCRDRDLYDFSVNLSFIHEEKQCILFRGIRGRTHTDRDYNSHMKLSLTVDGEAVPNADQYIQRIVPPDVSRFFFFDGEMLSDYEELLTENGVNTNLLRNSIERVLGIPYLKTARDDIKTVERNIEGQIGKLIRRLGGKTYQEMLIEYERVNEDIRFCEGDIKDLEEQLNNLLEDISRKKRDLTKIESVKKLSEERMQLENEISQLRSEKKLKQNELNKTIAQLYKRILMNTATNIIANLTSKHEQKMSKYNSKQRLIAEQIQTEKAISQQKCEMCGTILNPSKKKELETRLEELKIEIEKLTEVPEPNLEYDSYIGTLERMKKSQVDTNSIANIQKDMDTIDNRIATKESKLSEVKESLVGQNEAEPKRIELEIRGDEVERGRLEESIRREKSDLSQFTEIKSQIDQQIASIDQTELKTLTKRKSIANQISQILDRAISVYRNQRKAEVESVATEIFKLIKSKQAFDKLKINDQFGLGIVTESGAILDRAELRSAGEEQIVALSLMGALNRCAKIRAPIFMDTPFGRLDIDHTEKILSYIPKMAEQVVIFVTNKEFRPGDEHFLGGTISSDFTVSYLDQDRGSEITNTIGGRK
ncbi:MAG: AAA family ATPase [Candidatus Thermoplasmatota archaeon]|nr:AAA family ATPase [Candidatus Thermoplasmatota archaeon]